MLNDRPNALKFFMIKLWRGSEMAQNLSFVSRKECRNCLAFVDYEADSLR